MANQGLAARLYAGEANINIIGRRKLWFLIAAALVVVSIASISIQRFHLGIEFAGGTSFSVPATAVPDVKEAIKQARARSSPPRG